jgi:hypothetical protein
VVCHYMMVSPGFGRIGRSISLMPGRAAPWSVRWGPAVMDRLVVPEVDIDGADGFERCQSFSAMQVGLQFPVSQYYQLLTAYPRRPP